MGRDGALTSSTRASTGRPRARRHRPIRGLVLAVALPLMLSIGGCARVSDLVETVNGVQARYPDSRIGVAYHNGLDQLWIDVEGDVPPFPEGADDEARADALRELALDVADTAFAIYPRRDELDAIVVEIVTDSRAYGLLDEVRTARFPSTLLAARFHECEADALRPGVRRSW